MRYAKATIDEIVLNGAVIIDLLTELLCSNLPFSHCEALYSAGGLYKDLVKYSEQEKAVLIGAFDGDILCGFAWLYQRQVGSEKRCHLNHIIVRNDHRGAGIGHKLVQCAEDFALERDCVALELMVTAKNEKARLFYQDQGFSVERLQMCKTIQTRNDESESSKN